MAEASKISLVTTNMTTNNVSEKSLQFITVLGIIQYVADVDSYLVGGILLKFIQF